MKFRNYFLLCLLVILVITACKKNGTGPKTKTDTDVYVVGSALLGNGKYAAVYWKNGVINKLSDSTINCYGYDIAVNDSGVYVTGDYETNTITAAYWKNGVETKLPVVPSQFVASAIAVNANGSSVYVAGTIIDGSGNHAVYWNNGVIKNLTPGVNSSGASKLTLNGPDVYIAGHIADTAVYWKNETLTKLDDTTISNANTIAFSGTDVYVAGVTVASNNHFVATYWNKGEATYLTNGLSDSEILAIAVSGNNVYAAGYTTNTDNYTVATYWKNGTAIPLTDNKTSAQLKAITLVGNDVYATGYTYINGVYQAVYWKNGLMKPLAGGHDAAGIVVVTHPRN